MPPIIACEHAPALLPRWGPVAPLWWGHSDHVLSANCPTARQGAGEHSMVNPLLNTQNKDVLKALCCFDLLLFKTFLKGHLLCEAVDVAL